MPVSEGSGKQVKMEETGCEIICGAPKTLKVKGWVKVKVILPYYTHTVAYDTK